MGNDPDGQNEWLARLIASRAGLRSRGRGFQPSRNGGDETRDQDKALDWLERSADQGVAVARFNIAYEMFESGIPENTELAAKLSQELVAKGFPGPDLRQYYVGSTGQQ